MYRVIEETIKLELFKSVYKTISYHCFQTRKNLLRVCLPEILCLIFKIHNQIFRKSVQTPKELTQICVDFYLEDFLQQSYTIRQINKYQGLLSNNLE